MSDDKAPTDDEILGRALELQAQDQSTEEATLARESQAEALAELGVPPEYLLRAEEDLQRERYALAGAKAERKRKMVNVVLGLCIIGVVASFAHTPSLPQASAPWVQSFDSGMIDWSVVTSPGTEASARAIEDPTRGKVVAFQVTRFDKAKAKKGRYYANLRSNLPPPLLRGMKRVSLWVRGEGLKATRLYLRKSDTERWRSPEIPVSSEWVEHTLPLNAFDTQVRARKGKKWKQSASIPLSEAERLQLKVGYFINDPGMSGTVYYDDLVFSP